MENWLPHLILLYIKPGLSASMIGGSLTPAWAAQAGYVPHRVTSIKFLPYQKFYASNAVWDIPCPGGPSQCQTAPSPRS